MYPKNVLLKYGHALPNAKERKAFLGVVTTLQTEVHVGVRVVMSGLLHAKLKDTEIEHLLDDLAQRWIEFAEPDDIFNIRRN